MPATNAYRYAMNALTPVYRNPTPKLGQIASKCLDYVQMYVIWLFRP